MIQRILARLLKRVSPHFIFNAGLLFLLLLVTLSSNIHSQDEFERITPLVTSDFVDKELLKGAHYQIDDIVRNDGFWNVYFIRSDYGDFEVHGTYLLGERIHEIEALTELKREDVALHVAQGAINTAEDLGKNLFNLAKDPFGTAEGIGGGLERLFNRTRRTAQRGLEGLSSGEDGEESSSPNESFSHAAKGSLSMGKSLIGMTTIERKLAKKVHVDPYTTNIVVRREIEKLAALETAGQMAVQVFVPIPRVVSVVASVSDIVWDKSPADLQTIIEDQIKEMGVSANVSRSFRQNEFYPLSWKALLVTSLRVLGDVPGREDYLTRAALADNESLALFFTAGATLFKRFHETQPDVTEIVTNTVLPAVRFKGDRVTLLFPADYVFWTSDLARKVSKLSERMMNDFESPNLEIWVTGRVSDAARLGLQADGWKVREQAFPMELSMGPAATDQ